jgi:hypothetical protein
MAVQLQGNSGVTAEVEANTRAMRVVVRPADVGALGSYEMSEVSGTMAAGLAASSPIYSFRWGSASGLAVIRSIYMSAGNAGTAFAAGVGTFKLIAARSFTVADTGGTALTLTGNNGKMRTSMGTTLLSDARIASTATLTAGTRTLDATAIGCLNVPISTAASTSILPVGSKIFDAGASQEYPLILAQNEGFVITASVPATGTWTFAVNVEWEEVTSW